MPGMLLKQFVILVSVHGLLEQEYRFEKNHHNTSAFRACITDKLPCFKDQLPQLILALQDCNLFLHHQVEWSIQVRAPFIKGRPRSHVISYLSQVLSQRLFYQPVRLKPEQQHTEDRIPYSSASCQYCIENVVTGFAKRRHVQQHHNQRQGADCACPRAIDAKQRKHE